MEFLGSRLQNHGDRPTRTDSIVGLVVAIERLELSQSIDRRKRTEAATAAAIIQFAAIQQPDVVSAARSVEADAIGTGQSDSSAIRRQVVRLAHAERCQRGYVATVGGDLRHLLTADQTADFAGFRLQLQ